MESMESTVAGRMVDESMDVWDGMEGKWNDERNDDEGDDRVQSISISTNDAV